MFTRVHKSPAILINSSMTGLFSSAISSAIHVFFMDKTIVNDGKRYNDNTAINSTIKPFICN